MAEACPVDKGSKEATFTALAVDFGFNDKVKDLFLKGHMENLEDFRYYFADEKEIDAFVAAEESLKGPELRLQISRVRRAWTAVRQKGLLKENRNTVSSVAELDNLLEEEPHGTQGTVLESVQSKISDGGTPIGSASVPLL